MIELTPEQREAVAQGEPVRVVDEATQDALVLMRAEVFDRMAGLPGHSAQHTVPPAPLRAYQQPVRVCLRELPTPPEVAAEAERWVKQYGRSGKNGRRDAEDRFKLQYYYGGQEVYTVRTAGGLVVIPIPEQYQSTPDLRYRLLTAAERTTACLEVPPPWNDDVNEILT